MKYSVNVRCGLKAIKMADEVYFDWRDRKALIDYIEKYPDKTFVQEIPVSEPIDYEILKAYNEKLNGNFYVALPYTWENYKELQKAGLKYYVSYPVNNMFEFKTFVDAGVSFVLITAPLTHKLDKLAAYNVALRMCPNVQALPPTAKDNVIGSWIRPEDVDLYAKYIDTLEFWGKAQFAETSLRIYKENKNWPDDLSILMPALGAHIDSRTVPPDAITARMNCGQRCLEGSNCRICHKLEAFSNTLKKAAAQKKN